MRTKALFCAGLSLQDICLVFSQEKSNTTSSDKATAEDKKKGDKLV